jgi:FkbM family methyltransferase
VGANIGLSMLPPASRGWRVLAFEPNPQNIARLKLNVALNGWGRERVAVVTAAVSDRNGSAVLFSPSTKHAAISALTARNVEYYKRARADEVHEHRTRLLRLDEYFAGSGSGLWPRVRVLKIDTQGHEVPVLRGMGRLLGAPPYPVILMEYEPPMQRGAGFDPSLVIKLLFNSGYRAFCPLAASTGRAAKAPSASREVQPTVLLPGGTNGTEWRLEDVLEPQLRRPQCIDAVFIHRQMLRGWRPQPMLPSTEAAKRSQSSSSSSSSMSATSFSSSSSAAASARAKKSKRGGRKRGGDNGEHPSAGVVANWTRLPEKNCFPGRGGVDVGESTVTVRRSRAGWGNGLSEQTGSPVVQECIRRCQYLAKVALQKGAGGALPRALGRITKFGPEVGCTAVTVLTRPKRAKERNGPNCYYRDDLVPEGCVTDARFDTFYADAVPALETAADGADDPPTRNEGLASAQQGAAASQVARSGATHQVPPSSFAPPEQHSTRNGTAPTHSPSPTGSVGLDEDDAEIREAMARLAELRKRKKIAGLLASAARVINADVKQ